MSDDIQAHRKPMEGGVPGGTVEVDYQTLLALCRWADNNAIPLGYEMSTFAVRQAVSDAYDAMDIDVDPDDIEVDAVHRVDQHSDLLTVDVTRSNDDSVYELTTHNSSFELDSDVIDAGLHTNDRSLSVTFEDDRLVEILDNDD